MGNVIKGFLLVVTFMPVVAYAALAGSESRSGVDRVTACTTAKNSAAYTMESNRSLEMLGKKGDVQGEIKGCECSETKNAGGWTCQADWSLKITEKK